MRQTHTSALAALQLVALQLFAALALAAPSVGSHTSLEARASNSAASNSASYVAPTRNTSGAQRRRRRARPLRAADSLTPGLWGGDHIRFEVTEGGARIDFDCAHAAVEGRIFVDGAGRFSASGTYYHERGGPVREGEEARGEAVRLSGRVGGSLMKLNVTRAGTSLGSFDLNRDKEGRVFKCR
jgi:hypothetical protein